MTCCEAAKQKQLYSDDYNFVEIENLKKSGNFKLIFCDKTIFWHVFCNSFFQSLDEPQPFVYAKRGDRIHVHGYAKRMGTLGLLIEAIQKSFYEAVVNKKPLKLQIEESSGMISFANKAEENPMWTVNSIDSDQYYRRYIKPNLIDLLKSAGAVNVCIEKTEATSQRIENAELITVEWQSNPELTSFDENVFLLERVNFHRSCIIQALGGEEQVQQLPVIDAADLLSQDLVLTAPIMRGAENDFFIFRYEKRKGDEAGEGITIVYNALKHGNLSRSFNERKGWESRSLKVYDNYGHGHIMPTNVWDNGYLLEMGCSRIERLVQHVGVSLLFYECCNIPEWYETDPLLPDGRPVIELI